MHNMHIAQCKLKNALCLMHNAPGKIQNGQCTSHNVCIVEEEPPCHTSKHAQHLLRVFPSFAYLSKLEYVCFFRIAGVSVYSLATIYIFRCMFSRVLFVLVCIELYAITAGNTSKLPTLPRVISCLSLS